MERRCLLSDQDAAIGGITPNNLYYNAGNISQPGATAPPADQMDVIPGYEGIGASGGCLPPPIHDFPQPPAPETQNRSWQIPSISEDLAKEAFSDFASSQCCYSKKPAKEMVLMDMQALNTYRYRLETFTESRCTDWATEPYHGQHVDGGMGVAPGPWDIPVAFPTLFQDASQDLHVPYTSSVKGCHSCLALGKIACKKCTTSGFVQCTICSGSGRQVSDNCCSMCSGAGRVRCASCSGQGSQICGTCSGKGQLLSYIKLTVKWRNNMAESVANKQSGFPIDKLSKVTGDVVFTDINLLVYPIVGFPDEDVNRASNTAVREHQAKFASTCRIIQQRQTIELIPITRVHYSWKEKTYIYFVYGTEHMVHADDYPVKCACCSIL